MRTQWTITGIVLTAASAAVGVAAALILTLGARTGTASSMALALVVLGLYLSVVAPWQHRWGATRDEVARPLPGEHLLDATHSTTRAITIEASPEKVWSWLAQIGYGRAGWYSYDWIDNDGKPSATRVLPDLQQPAPDDEIPMTPTMSFTVIEAVPPHHLLLRGGDESTWCLTLYRADSGTRLVSRFRSTWSLTPASAFWLLIADPGFFIMERKMLKGIKLRAESEPAAQAA
jgi:hypothetical protein